jgi:tRNA threonylcarbamoyladenosine biosynthesis protein TsaB
MKILALESSGKTFSIALNDNGKTVAAFYYDCGLIHSEMIIPSIEKILKDTQNTYQSIDSLAVSTGPGSFTGIRVALTAVKIIAQSISKPVIAIDALTILEKSVFAPKGSFFVSAIDALRNEIYVKDIKGQIIIKPVETFCDEMKKHKNKISIIGNAVFSYREIFTKLLGKKSIALADIFHFPKASILGTIAQSMKPLHFSKVQPLYIRRTWAEESKNKIIV